MVHSAVPDLAWGISQRLEAVRRFHLNGGDHRVDNAKKIARETLDAINVDGSGFLGAVAKGVIAFPVSLGCLGYDVMDTEHRRENRDDKFRLARLIESTIFNRRVLQNVINVFINDFSSRLEPYVIARDSGGAFAGKMLFSQLTGIKLGGIISERILSAILSGVMISAVISIGAEASRAIYTARYLRQRNPTAYYTLQALGDLDLLYFIVEDSVKPFEKACAIGEVDATEFNTICQYFLDGI